MNENLKARILDAHTVLLGNDSNWTELSLPWLARDLAELLPQAMDRTNPNASELDKERIFAIRLAMSKLETQKEKSPIVSNTSLSSTEFYRKATLVNENEKIPPDDSIVLVMKPTQMLFLEEKLAQRKENSLTSVLVYSDSAVLIGPILETYQYCNLCLRYLISPIFSLLNTNPINESFRLESGIALARCVDRDLKEILILDHDKMKLEKYLPFIGCPNCFPNQ